MKEKILKLEEQVQKLNTSLGSFISVFIGIILIPHLFLKFMEAFLPSIFWIGVLSCFVVLVLMYLWILNKDFYTLINKKVSSNLYVPLTTILSIGWLTIICFGALTSTLCDAGLIQLEPAPEKQNFVRIADFYFWYALDLVPGFKINEIFHNPVPFTYTNRFVSFLVFLFEILIVWIIIGQVYNWLEWKKINPAVKK